MTPASSSEHGIIVKEYAELSTDELYELLRCRQDVFVTEQHCFYQDLDGLDRAALHLYIPGPEGPVAYMRVIRPGAHGDNAVIGRVVVQKKFRGHGLGRFIMECGIREALRLSPSIDIEAQAYLIDFYTNLGFKVLSEPYIHAGTPHIHMRLSAAQLSTLPASSGFRFSIK